MEIFDSWSSIASSGHTPTQHPQKSHFPGIMWIINGVERGIRSREGDELSKDSAEWGEYQPDIVSRALSLKAISKLVYQSQMQLRITE